MYKTDKKLFRHNIPDKKKNVLTISGVYRSIKPYKLTGDGTLQLKTKKLNKKQ